jgi:hypothetical protein
MFFLSIYFKKIILNWERENLSIIKHSQKKYGYHLFKKFSIYVTFFKELALTKNLGYKPRPSRTALC